MKLVCEVIRELEEEIAALQAVVYELKMVCGAEYNEQPAKKVARKKGKRGRPKKR